jgi:hypothetical protein
VDFVKTTFEILTLCYYRILGLFNHFYQLNICILEYTYRVAHLPLTFVRGNLPCRRLSVSFEKIFLAVVYRSTLAPRGPESIHPGTPHPPAGHLANELTSMVRRRLQCRHGTEESAGLLPADGPEGLDAAGAEVPISTVWVSG